MSIYLASNRFTEAVIQLEAVLNDDALSPEQKAAQEAEILAALDSFGGDLETEVIRWAKTRAELKEEARGLKELADRYAAKRKLVENYVERVDAYALEALKLGGQEKVSHYGITASIGRSEAVRVTCSAELPVEFQRVIPESREPDKAKIKAAIKEGQTVPGAQIAITEFLRVR